MRTARAVAAIALLALAAGCGGGSHARRNAVNAYFDRVDAAQSPVRRNGAAIAGAFSRFSTAKRSPKETAALTRAHALLVRTSARVGAVHPPAEAAALHRDLVRLYALETGVASELLAMNRFLPAYRAALAPVQPAHAALAADLKTAKGFRPIAAAFARYRMSLAGVLSTLDDIAAPATLRPSLVAERRSIRTSVRLCVSIESALARHDSAATAGAITQLAGLSTDASIVKARNAQIAATKAYNARLGDLAALQRKLAKERDKLVQALG